MKEINWKDIREFYKTQAQLKTSAREQVVYLQ